MAVKVFNPDTLDQVLQHLDRHFDKLDQIIENTKNEIEADEYHRHNDVIQCAGGQFQYSLPSRQGYDKVYDNIIVTGDGPGIIAAFVDMVALNTAVAVQNSSLVFPSIGPFGAAGNIAFLNTGPNGIYIPDSSTLIIVGVSFSATALIGINCQEKRLKNAIYDRRLRKVATGEY